MFALFLHFVIVAGFTARILLRDDLSPVSRLAWFTVIVMLPFFGGVLYFLFGEVDIGHHVVERHKAIALAIQSRCRGIFGSPDTTKEIIPPAYFPGFSYAASVNGFNTVLGNAAALMPDAASARQRMIDDIDAARTHVHVLYYIWLEDHTGINMTAAIIRAARRGVVCRVMVDGLGSRAFTKSKSWKAMKEAGVQAVITLSLRHPIYTILTSRIDLRNHRKITIIDNRISYCGSQNCADPEFRIKAKFAPWVDIMLRLEGEVVAQNQVLFACNWAQSTGEILDAGLFEAHPAPFNLPAQVMGGGPTGRQGATPQLFSTLISTAQDEIVISTPYFVPDATVLEALCAAACRGVDVTLVFPRKNDSWIVSAASRSYYRKLLHAGAKIHEFRHGLLHAKTLTIDGIASLIGSANLDLRSFDLNYENNVILYDAGITAAIKKRQFDYIGQSDPVHIDDVLAWSYPKRIWNNIIATIGPVL